MRGCRVRVLLSVHFPSIYPSLTRYLTGNPLQHGRAQHSHVRRRRTAQRAQKVDTLLREVRSVPPFFHFILHLLASALTSWPGGAAIFVRLLRCRGHPPSPSSRQRSIALPQGAFHAVYLAGGGRLSVDGADVVVYSRYQRSSMYIHRDAHLRRSYRCCLDSRAHAAYVGRRPEYALMRTAVPVEGSRSSPRWLYLRCPSRRPYLLCRRGGARACSSIHCRIGRAEMLVHAHLSLAHLFMNDCVYSYGGCACHPIYHSCICGGAPSLRIWDMARAPQCRSLSEVPGANGFCMSRISPGETPTRPSPPSLLRSRFLYPSSPP